MTEIIAMAIGVLLTVGVMVTTAWIIHRFIGKPGTSFLGQEPKGEVFTIPDAESAPDFPDDAGRLAQRTEKFLKILGGDHVQKG